jgi:hypothetical protein
MPVDAISTAMAADQIIDTICSMSESDIDAVVKRLRQDRVADINEIKRVLQALGERLDDAKIIQLHPR